MVILHKVLEYKVISVKFLLWHIKTMEIKLY